MDSPAWPIIWVVSGIAMIVTAVRAGRSLQALHRARAAVAAVFLVAGALANTVFFATGSDYSDFGDSSYIPFVRDTWHSLVAPHQNIFIPTLIAFEAAVGVLVLLGGSRTRLALLGAIGFHLGLMTFGWAFYGWAIPMIGSFVLVWRAERKHATHGELATIYRLAA